MAFNFCFSCSQFKVLAAFWALVRNCSNFGAFFSNSLVALAYFFWIHMLKHYPKFMDFNNFLDLTKSDTTTAVPVCK